MDIKARLFATILWRAGQSCGRYIGRINQTEKEAIEDGEEEGNYRGTDYIGKLGVEQSFEQQLHGITGVEQMETSAGGRALRKLASSPATPGNTVMLSLDIACKSGRGHVWHAAWRVVAINPKTGEVLAFVSKPSFDPNLFVDGIDQESWDALNESLDKPLLNRALRGTYPPAQLQTLHGHGGAANRRPLAHHLITTRSLFLWWPQVRQPVGRAWRHHGHAPRHCRIQQCTFTRWPTKWRRGHARLHGPAGFGQVTGIDINGECVVCAQPGWKRGYFKRPEQQKWFPGETISLGIGQGYNSFTMLQLAQATATLATTASSTSPGW